MRDIALEASGLLNPAVGGPSVFPPAPAFLFLPPASYGPKSWKESDGAERYRRALYTFRYRSAPYPVLQAFDAPNGDFACVRRSRSNTPLQALTLLNDPIFVEAARKLAERSIHEGGATAEKRLAFAFRLATGRAPDARELRILQTSLKQMLAAYHNDAKGARALIAVGVSTSDPSIPEDELAAYTAVANIILNMDETITKS